jgi:nitrogen-specific signal transduction histidine kinase
MISATNGTLQVWRQKEAALQSSQLTRLLLANSAHEVRTPLNAIINYLEIALEGALDKETRENLAKSHSASKSLIYVINDLLDLTKAEEGQDLVKDEIFDLPATIKEATDSFKGDAKRKGLEYKVIEHPGVPQFVHGDQRRVRQAVANITANAMQHTTSGLVHIEIWLQEISDGRATVEIVVQDSGSGMANDKLDALFQDLEQVTTDGDGMLDDSEEGSRRLTQGKDNRILGLGLAMVARIVRNMDGQLRLKSEEGKGSRFVIQLPFVLPNDGYTGSEERPSLSKLPASALPPVATPPPVDMEGEVTLVDKISTSRAEGLIRKQSIEDVGSLHSFRSGSSNKSTKSAKSDVDRLIDAISGPLLVDEAGPEGRALHRQDSRGSGHSRKSIASPGNATSMRASGSSEMPGKLTRSKSYGAPEHLRGSLEGPAGSEYVTDNKTLLRAVRMPDEFAENPQEDVPSHVASKVFFDLPDEQAQITEKPRDATHLQILVAEDDPVNSRIIQKRLEKSGHDVHHTVNGEDCASAYGEKPAFFDVVLMDMQVSCIYFLIFVSQVP